VMWRTFGAAAEAPIIRSTTFAPQVLDSLRV
jgi:hypothetical protein